jgi:acetylglutamate kinase
VTRVDAPLIETFCAGGVVPVIPSLALDGGGGWLNVNADTAAAGVAAHLRAEKLVVLTDTPGILRDRSDPASLVPTLGATGIDDFAARGVIDGGMLPKVEACLESLRAGVRQAHLIDGRLRHSLLLEIYTDRGVGTEITLH